MSKCCYKALGQLNTYAYSAKYTYKCASYKGVQVVSDNFTFA